MKRLIAALGFTLLASPAFAGLTVLSTAAASDEGNEVTCNATNVSPTKSFDIFITIFGQAGTEEGTQAFMAVAPGHTVALSEGMIVDNVRCVFEFSESSKLVRADMEVTQLTSIGDLSVVLPAS
jgi:hypothetical protein